MRDAMITAGILQKFTETDDIPLEICDWKKRNRIEHHQTLAIMSDNENLQEPLLERISASPEPKTSAASTKKSSKKRKRTNDLPEAKKTAKKPKSKKSKAADEDGELDLDAGLNLAFSHMDSQLLADYMAQRTRRYESDLSSIELEDRFLPGTRCIQ